MRQTLFATAFALVATAASAHAFLKTAQPSVGSTVQGSPTQVIITFTGGIEPHFTTIAVQDSAGQAVDDGQLVSSAPDKLAVGLKPLPPGAYKVIWHATSVDTHKTEGSYTFTVAK